MYDVKINKEAFENADVMVGVKVTPTERELLQKAADENNTTVSKLVRHIVVSVLKNESEA